MTEDKLELVKNIADFLNLKLEVPEFDSLVNEKHELKPFSKRFLLCQVFVILLL